MSKKHEVTAIIYDKRGNVLSIGKNSYTKSHVKMAKFSKQAGEPYKIWLHAEVSAIIKLKGSALNKAYKISIFRYNAEGRPALACPCKACAIAISHTPIKVIEHT